MIELGGKSTRLLVADVNCNANRIVREVLSREVPKQHGIDVDDVVRSLAAEARDLGAKETVVFSGSEEGATCSSLTRRLSRAAETAMVWKTACAASSRWGYKASNSRGTPPSVVIVPDARHENSGEWGLVAVACCRGREPARVFSVKASVDGRRRHETGEEIVARLFDSLEEPPEWLRSEGEREPLGVVALGGADSIFATIFRRRRGLEDAALTRVEICETLRDLESRSAGPDSLELMTKIALVVALADKCGFAQLRYRFCLGLCAGAVVSNELF